MSRGNDWFFKALGAGFDDGTAWLFRDVVDPAPLLESHVEIEALRAGHPGTDDATRLLAAVRDDARRGT